MTQEQTNILEGNKELAIFLGYEYFPKIGNETKPGWRKSSKDSKLAYHYLCRNHNDLPFLRDYNYLMRVVEKIESIYDEFHGHFVVYIHSNSCTIQGTKLKTNPENFHPAYYNETVGNTKIESVWEQCVWFVRWFNKNLKK